MKMQKKQFRIGDLAENLGVETSVIRFWEKEFSIEPQRSEGGQRFYTEKDLHKFQQIKELLYYKKYTIAGAKDELKQHKGKTIEKVQEQMQITVIPSKITQEILKLQDQLIKLRELL